MEVICIENAAFYALLDKVVKYVSEKHMVSPDKWINDEEAMKMLGITSRNTLQKYRDEGRIRFSQPDIKPIMYDRDSINEYFEKHAKNTF